MNREIILSWLTSLKVMVVCEYQSTKVKAKEKTKIVEWTNQNPNSGKNLIFFGFGNKGHYM